MITHTGLVLEQHSAQNKLELDYLEISVSSPAFLPEIQKEESREGQKENER